MNTELKALVKAAVDAFKAGKLAVEKANFITQILPSLYAVAMDIPAIASNWSDLLTEIKALPGSANEADLIAYIQTEFEEVSSDEHAKAILGAVMQMVAHLAEDAVALAQAISPPAVVGTPDVAAIAVADATAGT